MARLRFLADMHISPATVHDLKNQGWDTVRVADVLDPRSSDAEILAYARRHGQIVVTQDLDFSALLAVSGEEGPSLISLRLEDARPSLVTSRLLDVISVLAEELTQGIIVSVDETTLRYRFLPIDRGRDD